MGRACASGIIDFPSLIEEIANNKALQYKKISFLDGDDLKQEVRIKCHYSVAKYDYERSPDPFTFLSVCADNKIRDIKRSLLYKHNIPCVRCPFWDRISAKKGEHDCGAFRNKMDCDKFRKHEIFVHNKLNANYASDIDNQNIIDNKAQKNNDYEEMNEYIMVNLPSGLHCIYSKFRDSSFSTKSIKPSERNVLFPVLQNIINKMRD